MPKTFKTATRKAAPAKADPVRKAMDKNIARNVAKRAAAQARKAPAKAGKLAQAPQAPAAAPIAQAQAQAPQAAPQGKGKAPAANGKAPQAPKGKRAAIAAAAAQGKLPQAPDWTKRTHYVAQYKALVELVAAKDVRGLEKLALPTTITQLARYRDLAVIALKARKAG